MASQPVPTAAGAPGPAATRRVRTTDGLTLAVHERGEQPLPTVVALHGYPDNSEVWSALSAELAGYCRVVSYDVRGAGASDTPRHRRAYRLDQLVEDLALVVEATSPDRSVHLLGHDWGSVQAWHAVTGNRLRGRIASFTSISGPCLDHAAHWMRARWQVRTPAALGELGRQLARSAYIGFFQLPVLPELTWYTGVLPRIIRAGQRREVASAPAPPTLSDGVNGLRLYRANMVPRLRHPRPRRTSLPVLVLAPDADPFVSASLQTDIAQWVPNLRTRTVSGGHWLPRTRYDLVARYLRELVAEVDPSG